MSKWLWAVFISLTVLCAATAQNETAGVQAVVEKVAPSIANVKVVIKTTMKMGGESMDEESKISLQGVVVTPDGLIMLSNSPFSPKRMMEMLAGESMPAGMDYKMTPTSIKVTFGNEDKEYDAFLAATDTKLDLAFVKVEGLGDRQLTPVDLGSAVDAKLGQQVIAVSRLTKGYDYAPYFALGQICGEIAKPRRAWMLLGDISQLGLPVFTLNGELVGVSWALDGTRYLFRDGRPGIAEDQPLDFHSPYGCSKGAADQYVRDYARIYGLPTCVFRMSCIYGPHQFGNEDQGWVAHFAISALAGRPVTLYGDGRQVRDILYVDDLVEALLLGVAAARRAPGRIYNVGGGARNAVSLVELLDLLEQITGVRIERRLAPWRPGDQRIYVSDIRKIGRELGWRPRTPKVEGVRRLVAWIRDNAGAVSVPRRPLAAEPLSA